MKSRSKPWELIVIGGGPGGYAAAFQAAEHGHEVLLVDPEENPGGVCLYRGCIPSKALLHAAELINHSRDAAQWGIELGRPRIDLDRLREKKDEIVARLTSGLGQLGRQRGVEHIQGRAAFLDAAHLEVTAPGGERHEVGFEQAIIATGSEAQRLPGQPDSPRILDSSAALELPTIPKSLLVIGGGYIGLELGTVYAALGSAVTVVEMTNSLLPGVDRDLVGILRRRLKSTFADIKLKTRVTQMKPQKNGIKVKLVSENDEPSWRLFDHVLVAVGRKPNTEGLRLERTKVVRNSAGFIEVDEQRRTADAQIYAIGDVASEPMLAHKASHEGRVAAAAIGGGTMLFEPRAIPAVVYTDPEVAWCGTTENEARAMGGEISVVRFPWSASGRAATLGRSDGVTKLIIEPESERILGVGLAGPRAGDLIAEAVLALEMVAVVDDLRFSIHPHPTLAETLMEAADLFSGESLHYRLPRRASRR